VRNGADAEVFGPRPKALGAHGVGTTAEPEIVLYVGIFGYLRIEPQGPVVNSDTA
jgi:hypothetical protein